jgi:hypothetical protein
MSNEAYSFVNGAQGVEPPRSLIEATFKERTRAFTASAEPGASVVS